MARVKLPVGELLAICILFTLTCAGRLQCFSTPSERVRASSINSIRSFNNQAAQAGSSSANNENAYTANYITAIEDESYSSGDRAFMVSTTDHNYAIYSPALCKHDWLTVTVNGDQVSFTTTRNESRAATLFGLNEQQRDFLAEVRSNFTQNLGGLKFAHYTSGSSTQLPQLASGYAAFSRPHVVQADIGQPPATPFERPTKLGLLQANGLPQSAGAFFSRSLAKSKRSLRQTRASGRLKWHARHAYKPAADTYGAPEPRDSLAQPAVAYEPGADVSQSLCSDRTTENFNYYNLLQGPLNVTLTGDVYYFDFHCNILDVYSASVSVRQEPGLSALYRDANFFSYSHSGLPLAINRFFLSDEQVFFVYNDGSVLVKMNWMLDQTELDVVLEARQQLKLVGQWQNRAADLLFKSANKKKSSTA